MIGNGEKNSLFSKCKIKNFWRSQTYQSDFFLGEMDPFLPLTAFDIY